MRLLRKFLSLRADERRLLVGAVILLGAIRVVLGRVPFMILHRMVVRLADNGADTTTVRRGLDDQVVWAVRAASDRAGGWTTCLSRALAVQALLARRGCPSRLYIGVARAGEGRLDAHAWVERDGRVLIGGTRRELARFSNLTAFDADRRGRPAMISAAAP